MSEKEEREGGGDMGEEDRERGRERGKEWKGESGEWWRSGGRKVKKGRGEGGGEGGRERERKGERV